MQNKHLDDKTSQLSGSMKYKTYKLRMISDDLLKNVSTHLAKSFKQPTHQTVKDALQTITSAQVQVPDPCKGEQRLIANHEPVYDFLAKIHDRHVSEKYKSSLYTLFASRNGGQENRTFCTFEYLMDQSSVFNFKQDNTIGGRTTTESDGMNNIIWLKVPDSFNTPISYAAPTKKTTYSPDHGISKVTNKPADDGSQYKKLGEAITGSYIDKTKSDTNPIRNTHVSPTNDEKTTNISDAKVDRANFLKDLAQNAVKFEINGNPNIAVGNIVTLNIPKKADADQSEGEKQMNDKVLIVRLRHKIGPLTAKPRYTMVVEAIKAGFYESGA
jgi:hypothetical protein